MGHHLYFNIPVAANQKHYESENSTKLPDYVGNEEVFRKNPKSIYTYTVTKHNGDFIDTFRSLAIKCIPLSLDLRLENTLGGEIFTTFEQAEAMLKKEAYNFTASPYREYLAELKELFTQYPKGFAECW